MASTHPPFTGRFIFAVDGIEIGAFREVAGLEVSAKEQEIKEGGQNEFVYKVPTRMTWTNVTLKRGVTSGNELFEWFTRTSGEGFEGQGNKLDRRQAAVAMLASDGSVERIWVLRDAFPVKWKGPDFSADSSNVATEELEVAHHGIWVDS